jgi:plastocyanin
VGSRLGRLALLTTGWLVSPALAGETIRVGVDKLKFEPSQVSAHVGNTTEWASSDFVVQTATARNKDWDVTIPAKGVGCITLQHPGDVDYFCRFHPNMTGRISVAPWRSWPPTSSLGRRCSSPMARDRQAARRGRMRT